MDFRPYATHRRAVADAIGPLIGTPDAGRNIRMGADGTPTKYIDLVAEECVLEHLARYPLCRTLISEEAGKVTMAGKTGRFFLDPIDGRTMLSPDPVLCPLDCLC